MEHFFDDFEERAMLRDVYAHLQDEESRTIYKARSLFSLTDEKNHLRDIVRDMAVGKRLLETCEAHSENDIVLFGAGTWGKAVLNFFDDIPWGCVVDNFKAGQTLGELPVISVAELRKREGTPFIVDTLRFDYEAVEAQLQQEGFPAGMIFSLGRLSEACEYFDLPALEHVERETFVDAGGFDGETSRSFARWAKSYERIYVFEPSAEQQEKCRAHLADLPDVSIEPYGLWSASGKRSFEINGAGTNCAEETNAHRGGTNIPVVSLDDHLGDRRATFIKMDIEGAEMAALRGAEHIIRTQHPKLAISVYHCRDDVWRVPMLLLEYYPDYRFYYRVYAFSGNDTVLYAIP